MKKILSIILMGLLIFVLVACSGPSDQPSTDDSTQTPPTDTANASEHSEDASNNDSDDNTPPTGGEETNPSDDVTSDEESDQGETDTNGATYDINYNVNAVDITGYDTITGSYLMVDDGVGSLSQQYINDILKNSLDSLIVGDVENMNPMTIRPLVMTQSASILSVLYEGSIQVENSEYQIWSPVNIDIQTTNQITVSSLVKSDLHSQEAFNQVFSAKSLDAGYEFESPEEWMGMYIEDDNLVYFFNENDMSDTYVLITVPINEVQSYLNYQL